MKKKLLFLSGAAFAGIIIFISCSKEYSCENCVPVNQPPVANAGANQVINLPKDSAILDGSLSHDPDGTISSFRWTRLSGPGSSIISNTSTVKTVARSLVTGVYQFELEVTDNDGLTAKDTVQVSIVVPGQVNRPPVANAGPDQVVILPGSTAILNGSASTDPDNNITGYVWTKLSATSSFTIANANTVQAQLSGLAQGVYRFELKVTDAGGLFSKDTIEVAVSEVITCNLHLTPVGVLSVARYGIATANAGNKVLFAGGNPYASGSGSRVDIYDMASQTWSIAALSEERAFLNSATAANKIFFAGGQSESSRIDIYDAGSNTWSTDELSEAKSGVAVAAVGNKVFFAGGMNSNGLSDAVEIFDVSSNTWTYAQLSEARHSISATTYGNKIYFAGGQNSSATFPSDKVDIYDASSDTWSTTTMTEPKVNMVAIGAAGKVFWAGGNNGQASCSVKVEMYDQATGGRSFHQFSQTSCFPKAGIMSTKLIFFTLESAIKVEVYDIPTQSWSFCTLNYSSLKAIANANNNIYCVESISVNGNLTSQVFRVDF